MTEAELAALREQLVLEATARVLDAVRVEGESRVTPYGRR